MPKSNATDTRIVQMQFDNKDFERNIKTSEKSLEKFKEYLDFSKAEKGLESFSRATRSLTFDNLVNNVQKLTDKFTGLGTISERILAKLRREIDQTIHKVSSFADSLGFSQIEAGKEKFEELNRSVKTIMAATGESEQVVYKYMERLNAYTDQTSYSFTDMASNIGKFTSVGIKLEDAEKQMEGIANWAARSGAGINEASRAMYNLSQAMGVGKMTAIDWKSIENANMATKEFKEQLIEAAIAAGTLVQDAKTGTIKTSKEFGKQVEVNFQNVRDTLKNGWANREVLEKTLYRYYYDDLYYTGENAIKVTEEQLEKIKEMFSDSDSKIDAKDWKGLESMGLSMEDVKQKVIDVAVAEGNLVKTTDKSGKAIYKTAKKYGKEIEVSMDNIETTLSIGWLDKRVAGQVGLIESLGKTSYEAAQKCTTLKDVFQAWQDQLSTGWMKVWKEIFGDLGESMELFSAICNKVGESFTSFIETLVGNSERGTRGIFGTWADMGGRDSLWSLFVGEYDGLYEGAFGILDVLKEIGNMISTAFWEVFRMLNPELYASENWGKNTNFMMENLAIKMKESIEGVKEWLAGVKQFFMEVPNGAKKSRFQMIQDIVNGIGAVAVIVYNTVHDIVTFVSQIAADLTPVIDVVTQIFSDLGIEMKKTAVATSEGKGLAYFLKDLREILLPLTGAINEFVTEIGGIIQGFIGANEEGSKSIGVWHSIADVLKKVAKVVVKVAAPVIRFFTNFVSIVRECFSEGINTESIKAFGEKIKGAFKGMADSIFSFIPNFSARIKQLWTDIREVLKSGFSKEKIDKLKADFGTFFDVFKKGLPDGLKNTVKTAYGSVKGFVTKTWKKVKDFFEPFITDVKNVFQNGFSKESMEQMKNRMSAIFQGVSDAVPEEIKGAVGGVSERIKNFFTKIWTDIKAFFEPFVTNVKNLFTKGINKETIGQVKDQVKSAFTNLGEAVPEGVQEGAGGIFDKIKNFFKNLIEKIKKFVTGIFSGKGAGAESGETLTSVVSSGVNTAIAKATDEIKPDAEGKNIFQIVIDWFNEGIGKIRAFIQKLVGNEAGDEKALGNVLDLSTIALILIGVLGVVGIVKTVKKILSIITTVTKAVDEISKFPEKLKESLRAPDTKEESVGDKWLKIAGAMAILTACIIFIGNMDWREALKGIIVVGGLIYLMSTVIKKMKDDFSKMTYEDIKGLRTGIWALIAMAVSVAILVAALKPLATVPWDGLIKMGASLWVIIWSFRQVAEMIKKNKKFSWKNMSGLLAFAGAIWLLIRALMPMKNIKDPMDWVRMFGALGIILGELFLFCYAVNKWAGGGKAVKGLAELAAVVAAIALLVFSLLPLVIIPWGGILKMVGFLGLVLLELAVFTIIVSQCAKSMKGFGLIQLAALALAIGLLVTALLPVALMNDKQIANMLDALFGILGIIMVFVVVVNMMERAMKGSGMAQLLALSGAILMLVFAMLPLTLLKKDKLEQGLIAIGALVALLAGFIVVVNTFTKGGLKGSGMAQLLGVAGAIVILALVMIPLSLMPLDKLLQSAGAIFALLVAMTLITFTLSKLKGGKQAIGNIAVLLVLAGVIYLFAVAIDKIKDVKTETIWAFAGGLAVLVASMALLVGLLSLANPLTIVAVMAAFAAGLVLILGAISLMAPILAGALGSAIEIFMAKMALVGGMFADFADGMNAVDEGAMDSAKRKFETLLAIVYEMRGVGGYMGDIQNFERAMLKLGNGISQFAFSTRDVGDPNDNKGMSFISSFLGLKDSLASFSIGGFSSDIALLGEGIGNFVTATSDIDKETPAMRFLASLAMQAANLDILSKLPLKTLKTNISELGGAFAIYAMGASEATGVESGELPDADKALALMRSVVGSFTKDEFKDFVIPELPDEGSLTQFGTELAVLATALTKFSQASQDIGDYSKAIDILNFLGELRSKLVVEKLMVTRVFKQAFVSESVLTDFGLEIAALGTSLYRFYLRTKDFKLTQSVKDALTFFSQLREKLKTDNLQAVKDFVAYGVDQQTLTDFGLEIGELGESLAKFAENVNFDKDKQERFNGAIAALDDISEIANRLPVVGGLAGLINGNMQTIGGLAGDIEKIGIGLADFSKALMADSDQNRAEYNATLVDSALNSLKALTDIISVMNEINKMSNVDLGGESIEVTIARLASFIDLLTLTTDSPFFSNIYGSSELNIAQSFVKMMKEMDDYLGELGNLKYASSFEAFRNMAEGIAALVNVNPELDFSKVGSNISLGIKSGIEKGQSQVVQTTIDVCVAAIKAAKDTTKQKSPSRVFMKIGRYLSEGMAIGIKKDEHLAIDATADMANSVINEMRSTLGIHSPSKEMEKIGKYMGLGLQKGFDESEVSTDDMIEQTYPQITPRMRARGGQEYWDQQVEEFKDTAEAAEKEIATTLRSGNSYIEEMSEKQNSHYWQNKRYGNFFGPIIGVIDHMVNKKLIDSDFTGMATLITTNVNAVYKKIEDFAENHNINQSVLDFFIPDKQHTTEAILGLTKDLTTGISNRLKQGIDLQPALNFSARMIGEYARFMMDHEDELNFAAYVLRNPDIRLANQDVNNTFTARLIRLVQTASEEFGEKPVEVPITPELKIEKANPLLDAILASLYSDEETVSPTITPVVDITRAKDGTEALNKLFSGSPLVFGEGNIRLDATGLNLLNSLGEVKDQTQNITAVKEEVAGLKENVDAVAAAVRNTKFIMSSGAVVAAIGTDMDEWLGEHGYFAARAEIGG